MFFQAVRRLLFLAAVPLLGIFHVAYSQSDNANSSENINAGVDNVTIKSGYAGPKGSKQSTADSIWEALSAVDFDMDEIEREAFCFKYFEQGKKFWNAFPNDYRKYEWLFNAMHVYAPDFFENPAEGLRERREMRFYSAPLKKEALKNWRDTILKFRSVYLEDQNVNRLAKIRFLTSDIRIFLDMHNKAYWVNTDGQWVTIQQVFKQATTLLRKNERCADLLGTIDRLFWCYVNFDISLDEIKEFVNQYRDDPNMNIRNWAKKKSNLLNVVLDNHMLFDQSLTGGQLQLEDFKGKVVLMDFWSVSCSSCIGRMPYIKSLSEKYGHLGFKVISSTIDSEADRKRIDKVIDKFGDDWTWLVLGGKDQAEQMSSAPFRKIWERYAYYSTPQMLLFDRKGKLVMLNGFLLTGDPEHEIKRLINEKY